MKLNSWRLLPGALCLLLLSTVFVQASSDEQEIDASMHHLGNDETPEWTEAPLKPEGSQLDLVFASRANRTEWTLVFTQRNINDRWRVAINDTEIAICRPVEGLLEVFYPVPAGTLVDGTNRFTLTTNQPGDDITFGRIRLLHKPFREALNLRAVEVRVTDTRTSELIPARVTLRRKDGLMPPIFYATTLHQAVRDGVIYTDHGVASFEVAAGEYEVFASRGPEWGLASAELTLDLTPALGGPEQLELSIEHEVTTGNVVSCDTHIHTLTFSGHGDSSVEERMVTLAGEGLDVAISTDHNHNTDYRPYQERMGLQGEFLTIVGNEVTTPIGHFNAFPLDPNGEIPPHDLHSVAQLVDGMRSRGAKTVILNHPRWPSHEKGPFGVIELSHFTGAGNGIFPNEYPFDAMELVNSTTEEKDPMLLFKDWFSLLNRGEKVFAVGSSDSHTVGMAVGGGRTYVHGAASGPAPGDIDVDALCAAISEGRSSISMGIYVDASVWIGPSEGASVSIISPIGSVTTPRAGTQIKTRVSIQAPSWIRPHTALLFANGTQLASLDLDLEVGKPTDIQREVVLNDEHAMQDAWYVWVVFGDGVATPHWPTKSDYTLGATNPLYLDWDADQTVRSPREIAGQLIVEHGWKSPALREHLAQSWPAVRMHALDLVRVEYLLEARERLKEFGAGAGADESTLKEFMDSLGDWDSLDEE